MNGIDCTLQETGNLLTYSSATGRQCRLDNTRDERNVGDDEERMNKSGSYKDKTKIIR